jgi:hypothetical protein
VVLKFLVNGEAIPLLGTLRVLQQETVTSVEGWANEEEEVLEVFGRRAAVKSAEEGVE